MYIYLHEEEVSKIATKSRELGWKQLLQCNDTGVFSIAIPMSNWVP
jgi:hypothetical protein